MEPETPNQPTPPGEPAGEQSDVEEAAAHDPAAEGPGEQPTGEGPGDADQPPPPPGADPARGGGSGWTPPFQILRSRHERKLGGVGGGLAAAANLDPTLVRIAIILGCLTGWGILAYLIAWAVIPEENPDKGRYLMPAPEPTGKYLRIGLMVAGGLGVLQVLGAILGIISSALIGIGLFPARIFGIGHDTGFDGGEALLGLLLLIGGLLLVFRRHLPWLPTLDGGSGTGGGGSWSPPAPPPPGMALATVSPGGAGAGATAGPPAPPSSGSANFGARATAAARIARTNGPLLLVRAVGWLVALWFLAGLVVGGAFWLSGAVEVNLPALPIATSVAALGVLGYTLVRSRRIGAVIGAMALLIVPTGLSAALSRVDGQAGDRSVTPIALSDLEPKYRHAAGGFALDLSRLQLPAGSRTPIDIDMGVGQIDVVVPWDAAVESTASVGAGTFNLFGNRQTGVNLKGRTRSSGQPGAPVLVISGEAGLGEVIVRRAYEPFTHEALRTGQAVPVKCSFYPARPDQIPAAGTGTLNCGAADGITETPPMNCVVAGSGFGLCRPTGEPEPAVDYAGIPGTRHCQVPAGGGSSTCTPPVPGTTAPSGGSFTCTIPEGGGPAVCRPLGTAGELDPKAPALPAPPAPPANPAAPADPATPPATAAPGEYRCTFPEGGGQATCEPA
jgi:phage shock protein PspC (stress-responsive transcriptional regulator)